MTLDEQQQLTQFLKQLRNTQSGPKDPEAAALIDQATAGHADASYLLVQRVLILEQALNAAKQQINDLQTQLKNPSAKSSFLTNDPWAATSSPSSKTIPGIDQYQAPRYAASPQPAQTQGSSFLGNMATTAAGVVAGSFLFQGIENLLGHHNLTGNHLSSNFDQPLTESTVINNYYGDDALANANYQDQETGPDLFNASDDNFADDLDSDPDWI